MVVQFAHKLHCVLDSMFRNISFESKLQTVSSQKQDLQNSVSLEIIHNSLFAENVYYIFEINSRVNTVYINETDYNISHLSWVLGLSPIPTLGRS